MTDDRIITEDERFRITKISAAKWRQMELSGKAPLRFFISDRRYGWRNSEIQAWIERIASASKPSVKQPETLPPPEATHEEDLSIATGPMQRAEESAAADVAYRFRGFLEATKNPVVASNLVVAWSIRSQARLLEWTLEEHLGGLVSALVHECDARSADHPLARIAAQLEGASRHSEDRTNAILSEA